MIEKEREREQQAYKSIGPQQKDRQTKRKKKTTQTTGRQI